MNKFLTFAVILFSISACVSNPQTVSNSSPTEVLKPIMSSNTTSKTFSHKTLSVNSTQVFSPPELSKELKRLLESKANCYVFLDSIYYQGLSPNPPIAACEANSKTNRVDASENIIRTAKNGVENASRRTYLYIDQNNAISLLSELKERYLPITSEEEALSFLLMQYNGLDLLTQDKIDEFMQEFTESEYVNLGTSFQSQTDGTITRKLPDNKGYEILNVLKDGNCHNDTLEDVISYSVNYRVTPEGEIQETSKVPLYSLIGCPIA